MKVPEDHMEIFKNRLSGIEDKILYEIEHLYRSGMVGENPSLSAIIHASIIRVAENWERGNTRDHKNLMRV